MMPGVPQSEWDAVPGGTGALARKPVRVQRLEAPLAEAERLRPGEPDLLKEGRLLHTAMPTMQEAWWHGGVQRCEPQV